MYAYTIPIRKPLLEKIIGEAWEVDTQTRMGNSLKWCHVSSLVVHYQDPEHSRRPDCSSIHMIFL